MGDSAGGNITMATLLAIRDLKSLLPSPASAIILSPRLDFTYSMPSSLDPITEESDYLSNKSLCFLMSPAWEKFERKATELSEKIRLNVGDKPKFWHESLECEGRTHIHVSNQGAAIPYVSPLLAESLGDLPPILVVSSNIFYLSFFFEYSAHVLKSCDFFFKASRRCREIKRRMYIFSF